MGEQLNPEEFDNFISVAVALKITVDGLQDFVLNSLGTLHKTIYRKCSIVRCNFNCSRRHGTNFALWCDACKTWKNELRKLNNFKTHWERINWKEIDTIDLPFSFQEMAKVFVQNFASVRQGSILQDMGAIMSLFRNMKTFEGIVNHMIISDTQRFRNQNFGHNYSLQLHEVEKAQSINCFQNLLRVPEIACTQSAKKSLLLLAEVRQNRKIPEGLLDQATLNIVAAIQDNFNRLNEIRQDRNLYETLQQQIQVNLLTLTVYPDQPIKPKIKHFRLWPIVWLILAAGWFFLPDNLFSPKRKNNSDEGFTQAGCVFTSSVRIPSEDFDLGYTVLWIAGLRFLLVKDHWQTNPHASRLFDGQIQVWTRERYLHDIF